MAISAENLVNIGSDHAPINYVQGKEHMDAITRGANEVLTHADSVNMGILPTGRASFARHSHTERDSDTIYPSRQLFGLERFFKAYPARLGESIVSVRLRLNNWADKLGIGLVSVSVEPLDRDGAMVLPPDDFPGKGPTIGSILPPVYMHPQALVGFRVDHDCAELIDGAGQIAGRTFSDGEGLRPPIAGGLRKVDTMFVGGHGAPIVTEGSLVALSVPVLDRRRLEASRLHYEEVERTHLEGTDGKSQIYTCRFLTSKAALRMIRKRKPRQIGG